MKIIVCVKYVSGALGFVELVADGTDVDPAFLEREVNEADICAVEEALRLRDASGDGEVVLVTVGDEEADEALRQSMAMGADRAVRVSSSSLSVHDPISVARALGVVVRAEQPGLVLCGVQSTDAGSQSTGPALASAVGLPCVAVVTKVELTGPGHGFRLSREFEGGLSEVVEVDGPVVITVQAGMNEPRYGSFKEKMRAKKAQIPMVDPGDLGAGRVTVRSMAAVDSSRGRKVQMIDGGPAHVAARIVQIVREVG